MEQESILVIQNFFLILKNNEFTPPASLVTDILNEMVKTEEERLRNQGIKKIDKKMKIYCFILSTNSLKA